MNNPAGKYSLSVIWALPVTVSIFLFLSIVIDRHAPHVLLISKALFLAVCFGGITSYIYRRVGSIGAGVFASILVIIITGMTPVVGPYLFGLFGLYCVANEIYRHSKQLTKELVLSTLWVALGLSVVFFAYFGLGDFAQPNNEAKLLKSQVHVDTLYHTAIAAMIKNYHVVSHGLHGLGQLEYHFGSHLILAAASNLVQITAFEAYSYLFVFCGVPLLGVMVIGLAEELLPSQSTWGFQKKLMGYVFIFLGTGVLAGGSLLSRFALWPSFLLSESYTISLILLLSLFSVMLLNEMQRYTKWLWVCGILALMTLSKVSTGFCGLALLAAWAFHPIFKWQLGMLKERWGLVLTSAVLFVFLFQYINPGTGDAKIELWQFVNAYVNYQGPFWQKLILFLLLQFVFPIVALVMYGISLLRGKGLHVYIPGWWMLGTLFSLIIGAGVLLLLYVTGGSGWYFANISMFMALPVLIVALQDINWRSRLAQTFLAGAVVLFLIYAPETISDGVKSFYAEIKQKLPDTNLAAYIDRFHQIRDDQSTRDALVYVPRSENEYWHTQDCRAGGYLIPAISQRPALYAWPSNECYDFLCGPRFHSNGLCALSQKTYSDAQLLAEAKRLGFAKVEVVTLSGIRVLQ